MKRIIRRVVFVISIIFAMFSFTFLISAEDSNLNKTIIDINRGENIVNDVSKNTTLLRFSPQVLGIYEISVSSPYTVRVWKYSIDEYGSGHYLLLEKGNEFSFSATVDEEKYFAVDSYGGDTIESIKINITCVEAFCNHENTTSYNSVEPTCYSLGYTEGVFCEECKMWVSGHDKIDYLIHVDSDFDKMCDVCLNEAVLFFAECGVSYDDNVTGKLYTDGTLIISGTGMLSNHWSGFEEETGLKVAIIENGITALEDFAFCISSIESIYIPTSVTFIGAEAFEATNLETVYYDGTQEEWDRINIARNNNQLMKANIHLVNYHHIEYHDETTPTCEMNGYTKGTYCVECEAWLEGHTIVETVSHQFEFSEKIPATCSNYEITKLICSKCKYEFLETTGNIYDENNHNADLLSYKEKPTCKTDGVGIYYCDFCGTKFEKSIPAFGHSYPKQWSEILPATCTERGVSIKVCDVCSEVDSKVLPKLIHIDEDGDYICDNGCGYEFEKTEPETPDEPENNEEEKPCDCNCHKGGITAFFFKLINFFAKLFDSSAKTCKCGAKH